MKSHQWRVIDLCCGLGGISLAASQLGCDILAGVDTSANSLLTFAHNFPTSTTICGDVSSSSTIQQCGKLLQSNPKQQRTVLVSGPPCQGFSVAGPRMQRDPRNRVLMAVAKAIIKLAPDAALVENVAALLSDRHSHTLQRFRARLRKAGYCVNILQLNAAEFGVPQHRLRMLSLISKKPLDREDLALRLNSMKVDTPTVRTALAGLGEPPVYGQTKSTNSHVANHVAMRHSQRVIDKISSIEPGKGPMSYRRLHPDRPARTLISGNRAPPAHFTEPRSITAREAARLQGFPDSFVIRGTFSNQLLHVTNAVPPPMAKAALSVLLSELELANDKRQVNSV